MSLYLPQDTVSWVFLHGTHKEGALQLTPLALLHAYSIRDSGMHAHARRSPVYAHRSTLHVTLYTRYNNWTSAARALNPALHQRQAQ